MKKYCVFLAVCLLLGSVPVFAQSDDVPYLSAEDIAAIELVLPDDIPPGFREEPKPIVEEVIVVEEVKNEISRLNTSQPVYHLLVLDRARSPLDSDISDVKDISVLYKYRHGRNGYLISVYVSSAAGPVFPQLPARSRIILDLVSASKTTIRDYINSTAFRKYVTNRTVINAMLRVL